MNVAFIPVRGGSKSIPLKNIKPICGKPLVYWTVKAASDCSAIDKVFVATDSDRIRETVESFGLEKVVVIRRSAETASDTASTESAMLEFAENYSFDNIVLIQATSPLLKSSDIEKGFKIFGEEDVDSVLSTVRQKRFNWQKDESGYVKAMNYDAFHRPRRQEFEGYLVENGAFYISSKEELLRTKNRVSGKIKTVEMSEDTFFEIDEPSDWLIVEALMKKNGLAEERQIPQIKMFLTDCDGCLTDGGMYYSEKGDELKKFNTRDGMAFSILRENKIITGIITSESVELNRRRAEKLKIDELITGCSDKLSAVKQLCSKYEIAIDNVAFVGDDINDIEVVKAVGLGCCPRDASVAVKEVADYVSPIAGGYGVVRDIVNFFINN